MKNKIIIGLFAVLVYSLGSFTSCQDMLDIDSSNYIDTDGNRFDSANDTLYSVVGILTKLQQLGDRYFVLGELRGDLVDITENTSMDLQEIANFTATENNPYVSPKEYYAVINNCNYFLQRVDTSIVAGGKKAMLGEYAVVKVIRAWTYMQLAMNHGKAVYTTKPILSTEDMYNNQTTMPCEQIIEALWKDMMSEPELFDESIYPNYGGFAVDVFIPATMVMADLSMWMGAFTGNPLYYETAATLYYDYIVKKGYRGAWNYLNRYTGRTFDSMTFATSWFSSIFNEREERISRILYSFKAEETTKYPPLMYLVFPNLSGSNFNYEVKPSQASIDLWANETYIHYISSTKASYYTKGDLRGRPPFTQNTNGSYYYSDEEETKPCINKYGHFISTSNYTTLSLRDQIVLYRAGKLYLNYAEALNALGKPSLAFAVLKHGLRPEVLSDTTKINPEEISPEIPSYCDFRSTWFSTGGARAQSGIHDRGSGFSSQDTVYYAFTDETLQENLQYYGFPESLATKQDSIDFVDGMICKELGLETAFEGNRFHDLMRFAIRKNDNDFLAKWVGRKDPALVGKLSNRDNWFLPLPK